MTHSGGLRQGVPKAPRARPLPEDRKAGPEPHSAAWHAPARADTAGPQGSLWRRQQQLPAVFRATWQARPPPRPARLSCNHVESVSCEARAPRGKPASSAGSKRAARSLRLATWWASSQSPYGRAALGAGSPSEGRAHGRGGRGGRGLSGCHLPRPQLAGSLLQAALARGPAGAQGAWEVYLTAAPYGGGGGWKGNSPGNPRPASTSRTLGKRLRKGVRRGRGRGTWPVRPQSREHRHTLPTCTSTCHDPGECPLNVLRAQSHNRTSQSRRSPGREAQARRGSSCRIRPEHQAGLRSRREQHTGSPERCRAASGCLGRDRPSAVGSPGPGTTVPVSPLPDGGCDSGNSPHERVRMREPARVSDER